MVNNPKSVLPPLFIFLFTRRYMYMQPHPRNLDKNPDEYKKYYLCYSNYLEDCASLISFCREDINDETQDNYAYQYCPSYHRLYFIIYFNKVKIYIVHRGFIHECYT